MASYPYAATLKTTSSSWFGPGGTRSQVSLLDRALPALRRPPAAAAALVVVVTHPRRTLLLRTWTLTRSRRGPSRPPLLSQSPAPRSPFRAARFGDGGLVQRQSGRLLHVTSSGVGRALGQLGTLPRCMVALAWRCQLVSLFCFKLGSLLLHSY